MAGTGPVVRTPLPQQKWEFLFHQTLLFADYQVRRLSWRGAADGLLPDGYDPNSLAAQAIFEFLASRNGPALPADDDDSLDETLWEIKRLVLKHVTRLHHRKENWLLSNAEDLVPVQIDDGDLVSPIELIPDPAPHPDATLLEKESLARFDSSKSRFSSFIKREPRLGSLFQLLCDGVEKPQALASSLKLRLGTVQNLRKRLRRRWRRCFGDSTTRK